MKIIFVDLTTKLNSFRDLETNGRGGMVSSLYSLPNALSQIGHKVYVLSDAKKGGLTEHGVLWVIESDLKWLVKGKFDFVVLNRQTFGDCFDELMAKHRVLWVHDMVHGGWIQKPEKIKTLSAVFFMSKYSQETWNSYYKNLPKKQFIIPNGVNKNLFYPQPKDLDQMLFFSAPNRGLEHLPIILETTRAATGRDLKMVAYSNMKKLHPQEQDKFKYVYENVKGRGVDLRDPVPQHIIADTIRRSGLMVKPNDYAETCSNTTLQALAAGVPVVTGPTGADKEWVKTGFNGVTTNHSMQDGPLFIMEMCRGVVDILKDRKTHERLIKNAPKTKGLFTWEQIGKKWELMLTSIF
jgi:glycosyltransferase involved in cell wall biosynthesis